MKSLNRNFVTSLRVVVSFGRLRQPKIGVNLRKVTVTELELS